MKRRSKIESLRQRAVVLRHNAARDITRAHELDREADALDSDVLDEESARSVTEWYFNTVRRMRACH